ncbi:MAG: ribosome biogenesis GTPase Der [Stappiaceae bacterium]
MSATVAIIGRPNVGKSTLFNRLVGKRLALVDDTPGVTRDRREGEGRIAHLEFSVIDTAGLEDADVGSLEGRMRAQTEEAMRLADVTLFVIDARAGITPLDEHFADVVRKTDVPVILVANKSEGRASDAGYYESFGLGLGEPVPISAEHGQGIYDLGDALRPFVEEAELEDSALENSSEEEDVEYEAGSVDKPLRIAVVGRPNAGKSTLINHILGEERLLTGPEAGITRDSISVDLVWREKYLKLFDTAGMRRKARVNEKLEKLSVSDGIRAIKFAELVVVVLDATIPFEKQDLQIIELVAREGRAVVIALNKWDLVEDRDTAWRELREEATRLLNQIKGVTLVPISGLNGFGLDKLLQEIFDAHKIWNMRISTSRLNRWIDGVIAHHPPPAVAGKRIRIRYATQVKSRPPHFVLFASRPDKLPDSYLSYLSNSLRETFKMPGTPIRVSTRKGENPYARKKKR